MSIVNEEHLLRRVAQQAGQFSIRASVGSRPRLIGLQRSKHAHATSTTRTSATQENSTSTNTIDLPVFIDRMAGQLLPVQSFEIEMVMIILRVATQSGVPEKEKLLVRVAFERRQRLILRRVSQQRSIGLGECRISGRLDSIDHLRRRLLSHRRCRRCSLLASDCRSSAMSVDEIRAACDDDYLHIDLRDRVVTVLIDDAGFTFDEPIDSLRSPP